MLRNAFLVLVVLAVLAGFVLLAGFVGGGGAAGAAPLRLRTVLVVPAGEKAPRALAARDCASHPRTCTNGTGGIELAFAVKGTAPASTTTATVRTDTNCDADANGISHCLNRLLLASGAVLVVRHDHSMMNDPCLSPGERVLVRRVAGR